MSNADLKRVFDQFAGFGDRHSDATTLDNSKFTKLVRDCKLIDGMLTPSQTDIIFAKAKTKGSRRMDFKQFCQAVELLAQVKYGNDIDGPLHFRKAIIASGGPQLDGVHLPETPGAFDRLTDTRLYVGHHRERFDDDGRGRGKEGRDAAFLGHGTVDQYYSGHVSDLSQILRPGFRGGTHINDRARASSPARSPRSMNLSSPHLSSSFSAAGMNQGGGGGGGGGGGVTMLASEAANRLTSSSPFALQPQQQYHSSSPGGSETSVTVRPSTPPAITGDFYQLQMQHSRTGSSSSASGRMMMNTSPNNNNTYNNFNGYTNNSSSSSSNNNNSGGVGTYYSQNNGETSPRSSNGNRYYTNNNNKNEDTNNTFEGAGGGTGGTRGNTTPYSSSMSPRQFGSSPAARNVFSAGSSSSSSSSSKKPKQQSGNSPSSSSPVGGGSRVIIESAELQAIFLAYSAFGTTAKMLEEVDSGRFAKLCRESGLTDGKFVTSAAVDVAFAKYKHKAKRTISYADFQQALAILAPLRHPNLDMVTALQSVVETIIRSGGPVCTTAAFPATSNGVFSKLTDTKFYTGTHKTQSNNNLIESK